MTAPEATTEPELADVAWDLSHLLDGAGADPQASVDAMLADAQQRADAFAAAHSGKVAELDGAGLVAAMHELAGIQELAGRAASYAHLWFSTDTADPARGALLQRVQEKGTAIETALLFFHLEWAKLDDARADELLATDGLDFARHHLRTARRYRDARRYTAEQVTAALQPGVRARAYAFNTLLADKMVDDRLRSYPHWLAARNLANEATDESVEALVEAVRQPHAG